MKKWEIENDELKCASARCFNFPLSISHFQLSISRFSFPNFYSPQSLFLIIRMQHILVFFRLIGRLKCCQFLFAVGHLGN